MVTFNQIYGLIFKFKPRLEFISDFTTITAIVQILQLLTSRMITIHCNIMFSNLHGLCINTILLCLFNLIVFNARLPQ